jgi:peptide subunit release factor 1 (eRF1)
MNDAEKYEFEETVKELESYRGRHTELISVLIPADFNINNVVKQIDTEKGTAENIKSKNVRKAVLDALERISRQLKLIGQKLPANGLAMYAGNVSEVEGQEDVRIWNIEPPKALKVRVYRCDQTFVVDPLREMLETDEVYGLLVIDRKEAAIGILEGKSIKMLHSMTSGVPSKQREILDEFFMMLAKQPEKIAYGMAEVEERLSMGAVGKLVISKELPREKIKHLEELAKTTSVEVHIVTAETQEGVQFLNIGGVGGILRYAVS